MAKSTTEERIEKEIEKNLKAKFKKWDKGGSKSSSGGLWFGGFIGAFVYYMQLADSFSSVVTGLLHALIWPATLVYKVLESFYGLA